MIGFLARHLDIPKLAIITVVVAGLLGVAGVGAGVALVQWRATLADARQSGLDEMKATYEALIARSNAEIDARQAASARAALEAEARANAASLALTETLAKLEAANAALPNGGNCGLDAARRRLLP